MTDMLRLPPNSRCRIVSLAPSATSILVALGARKALAGVSRWCKDVADVGKLPAVGDCWALDVTQVMELRPTLLVGSVPFRAETIQKLLNQPVAFLALNPRSLADIESNIRLLGGLVNRGRAAERVVRAMRRSLGRIQESARRAKTTPLVYCEAWPNPRISSPPWVSELVEIAGGKMVLPAGERVSDEMVAEARPELIVLAWTATGNRARPTKTLENRKWKDIPAVRNRRVVVIRDDLLNTPGLPLIEGARALFRAIHPELDHASPGQRVPRRSQHGG